MSRSQDTVGEVGEIARGGRKILPDCLQIKSKVRVKSKVIVKSKVLLIVKSKVLI